MALIEWNDDLSVKIDTIDEQHKKLVGMINGFYEGLKAKSGKENIAGLLKQMKEYTIQHFGTEENYFRKFNFPGYEAHKKEHEKFIMKVKDIETKYKEDKILLSFDITNFLKDWIRNHIQGTDMQYSGFSRDKGIK